MRFPIKHITLGLSECKKKKKSYTNNINASNKCTRYNNCVCVAGKRDSRDN